jgi:hypothetical protein
MPGTERECGHEGDCRREQTIANDGELIQRGVRLHGRDATERARLRDVALAAEDDLVFPPSG